MCFDRNINGNMDVKFLIGIIGHCTDQRKLLYIGQKKGEDYGIPGCGVFKGGIQN